MGAPSEPDFRAAGRRAEPAGETRADAPAPSFEELYHEHFDYVWRTARRLGVRPEETDDVVQEIFITVHRLLPRYEAKNIRGWLYSVTARIALHHHRAMRRHSVARAASDGELDAVPDSLASGPESSAETGESVRLLESLLDQLDTEKRAVLVLAGIEQLPLAEIAAILEINVNTVASRLRAAREQIQEGLARHRARDQWRIK